MKGAIDMKNFIREYLFKYIFLFFFYILLGVLIKALDMNTAKALGFVCGMILYDVLAYIYRRFKKMKPEVQQS